MAVSRPARGRFLLRGRWRLGLRGRGRRPAAAPRPPAAAQRGDPSRRSRRRARGLIGHDAHGRDRSRRGQLILVGYRRAGFAARRYGGTGAGGRGLLRRPPPRSVARHVRVEGLVADVVRKPRRIGKQRKCLAALRRAALAPHQNVGREPERILLQRAFQRRDRIVELRRARPAVAARRLHGIEPGGGVDAGRGDRARRGEQRLRAGACSASAGAFEARERAARHCLAAQRGDAFLDRAALFDHAEIDHEPGRAADERDERDRPEHEAHAAPAIRSDRERDDERQHRDRKAADEDQQVVRNLRQIRASLHAPRRHLAVLRPFRQIR